MNTAKSGPGEFAYAAADDFRQAAARILKFSNEGLQDAQNRLASEGFFKRAKLRRVFAPSVKLLRRLLAPLQSQGSALYKTPELAETYCRGLSAIVMQEYGTVLNMPASRRLLTTMVEQMAETTAEVLTKRTHDECWFGSATLTEELRAYLPPEDVAY